MRRIGMAALAALMLLMVTAGLGAAQSGDAEYEQEQDKDRDQEDCQNVDFSCGDDCDLEIECTGDSCFVVQGDGNIVEGCESPSPDPDDGTGTEPDASQGNSAHQNNNATNDVEGDWPEPQGETEPSGDSETPTELDAIIAAIVAIITQILANASTR